VDAVQRHAQDAMDGDDVHDLPETVLYLNAGICNHGRLSASHCVKHATSPLNDRYDKVMTMQPAVVISYNVAAGHYHRHLAKR